MSNNTSPLLYRAAREGIFGECSAYGQGCIADALFVFLDGEPCPESIAALQTRYRARPWVCLTHSWEGCIQRLFPCAEIFRRHRMKPAQRFQIPDISIVPPGYRISRMDEAAFMQHPFSHGIHYPSYVDFHAEGSGAVAYLGKEIVASASSFLSLNNEVELDVSTKEAHRGKGLATACAAWMLHDCMQKGITVHWDAQNDISLHLALKFGFCPEKTYPVYFQR